MKAADVMVTKVITVAPDASVQDVARILLTNRGLIRWPVKLFLPLGFGLLALQGVSEIIKRVAALEHKITADFKYEKPLQ